MNDFDKLQAEVSGNGNELLRDDLRQTQEAFRSATDKILPQMVSAPPESFPYLQALLAYLDDLLQKATKLIASAAGASPFQRPDAPLQDDADLGGDSAGRGRSLPSKPGYLGLLLRRPMLGRVGYKQEVELTRLEWHVFVTIMAYSGACCPIEEICRVWNTLCRDSRSPEKMSRAKVYTALSRLRWKLAKLGITCKPDGWRGQRMIEAPRSSSGQLT
ncbi:MAG: hypothetical protein HQ567_33330 [Candidatus Nealsonbacteria bacterium]|nr:hypothetical protein [Candidatus Nealsonbacteria bacterium]